MSEDNLVVVTEWRNKTASKIYEMILEKDGVTVNDVIDVCQAVERLAKKSKAQKYDGEINAFTVL